MRELKWSRYISRSNGGYTLCALKNVVRDAVLDVEMILKESPVGDHAADGAAVKAVKVVKRQVVC